MRRIVFLVVDRVELFDLAGPVQVFHEAAVAGGDYRIEFVSQHRHARSEQVLAFTELAPLPRNLGPNDTIVVPGSIVLRKKARAPELAELREWIRRSHDAGATVTSVCVGAFLLAAAGILDGRDATTHWKHVEQLQREFPRVNVLANRLYVFDKRIATSAGIASGVDLALAMVEKTAGARIAAIAAREMVISRRRPGEDEQLSPYFEKRDHLMPEIHAVQDWLVSHPAETYTLESLASKVGVSTRTLTRQFRAATGTSVKAYATSIRLEQARQLLRDRTLTVNEVAERCGFAGGRHLRRLWKEMYGHTPSEGRAV